MQISNLKMLVLGLALVAAYLPSTFALYCWQCNSVKDKFCNDVPAGPVMNVSQLDLCLQQHYKECESGNGLNYTFCRKQIQSINNQKRVIRSCGFERAPTDCYVTKNPQVNSEVCQCDGDGCNHSAGNQISLLLAVLSILCLGFTLH